jgi:hypothetical protein
MFEIARAQGKHAAYLGGPVAGLARASCHLRDWLSFITYRALRLTDRSFEPPWGCAQGNPLAAKGRLHRTMGPG